MPRRSFYFQILTLRKKKQNRNKHYHDYPPLPRRHQQQQQQHWRCPCWTYRCPHQHNSCHLPLFKCQTLLNILLFSLRLITLISSNKAIILKCSSDCCWNTFKIIIIVMFLIKNYYSFPLMHSQYFSNCLSDHSEADVLQAVPGPTPICHYFYFFYKLI